MGRLQVGIVIRLLDIVVIVYSSRVLSGITREYCLADSFEPRCESGEVVVMQQAHYGRMRVGRCVEMDRGALGCYSDELATFDRQCSGQTMCSVGIYDDKIITTKLNCLNELKPYLEAEFICTKVYSPKRSTCSGPEIVPVLSEESFLSSQVSMTSSCGSHSSPWLLEAKPGQTINISLLDFGWDPESSGRTGCRVKYGYIVDVDTDDIMNICGGGDRQKQLYRSTGNKLQVILELNNQLSPFLLQYQAIGCPDYDAPVHAWTEAVNDSLVVGCHTSEATWKLKCVGGIWLGIVGTCAPPSTTNAVIILQDPEEQADYEPYSLPPMTSNHVVAFGLGCLTLTICCVVVILGFYCTKRYAANYKMKSNPAPMVHPTAVRTLLRNRNPVKATLTRGTPSHADTDLPTYSMALSKDQRAPPVPHRTSSYRGGDMTESMMSDYLAPQGGDDNSVQYYILENPTESGGKEEMYQSIHLFSSLERAPDNTQ